MCSRRAYKAQMAPALLMAWLLKKIFKILDGVGRILNADESMSYRYNQVYNTWTI